MIRKPIIFLDHISRTDLKAHPDWFFIFGDNVQRTGRGGQAAEMRGEPNAVGVVTKRKPTMNPDAFFSDENDADRIALATDLMRVVGLWHAGYQIVAPKNGLGTERARLKEKAPKLFNNIIETFRAMSDENYPWADF
jgi:hypothetical protein